MGLIGDPYRPVLLMYMTIKELKKILEKLDENMIVVMSSDGEGNSYSPLSSVTDDMVYQADSTWSGEVGYGELTPELEKLGYSEADVIEGVPALILNPVN